MTTLILDRYTTTLFADRPSLSDDGIQYTTINTKAHGLALAVCRGRAGQIDGFFRWLENPDLIFPYWTEHFLGAVLNQAGELIIFGGDGKSWLYPDRYLVLGTGAGIVRTAIAFNVPAPNSLSYAAAHDPNTTNELHTLALPTQGGEGGAVTEANS